MSICDAHEGAGVGFWVGPGVGLSVGVSVGLGVGEPFPVGKAGVGPTQSS